MVCDFVKQLFYHTSIIIVGDMCSADNMQVLKTFLLCFAVYLLMFLHLSK